jgi:hypothetical protein
VKTLFVQYSPGNIRLMKCVSQTALPWPLKSPRHACNPLCRLRVSRPTLNSIPFFLLLLLFVLRITARLLPIPTSSANSWYGCQWTAPCDFVVWDMSAALRAACFDNWHRLILL